MRTLSLLIQILLLAAMMPVAAADPHRDYDETVFMDMELEDNINTPEVPKKEKSSVVKKMKELATSLSSRKLDVQSIRDDEVLLVVIPSDRLFQPNDTLLSPEAPAILAPIVSAVAGDPLRYKLVYAVHTDNTGSEYYNNLLSEQRNNSIYEWLLPQVNEELIIIPYEMGDTAPVESNDSRRGRAANRRVEFYIIPGPTLISSK